MSDRVLLVDDEPQILSALRRELASEPFEVMAVGDPREALAAIDRHEFALIVSDNVMPGGSGLDLLAAARDRWPLTRRLLLTGATDANDAVTAFNDGTIHRFIRKPWVHLALIDLLRKEAEIYRTARGARDKLTVLEETAKARTSRLIETLDELKQSRTQVALFEDFIHLEKLVVPPRVAALGIWIVDENEAVRELLVTTLKKAGIKHCVGVPNPMEALARLQNKEEVQLILSEWQMTPLDGLAFFRRLREEGGPAAKTKFILMTGREQRPLVEFALKAGIDGYIIKPFRLQALFDQIDRLFDLEADQQERQRNRMATLTCLVANQHAASCEQIRHLLISAGIRNVFAAQSGQIALRMLNERNHDVLIYDVNVKQPHWSKLPGVLGSLPRAPALLLTSVLPTQADREEIRREGITNFLSGPFRQAELLEAIVKAAGLSANEPQPRASER